MSESTGLAEYVFGEGIRIYYETAPPGWNPDIVTVHENYHLHLCNSTPFGLFQKLLGHLKRQQEIPSSLRSAYSQALATSIEYSWLTHEGVATTGEFLCFFLQSRNVGNSDHLSTLHGSYEEAVRPFVTALLKDRFHLLTMMAICEAIGYVCLATNILMDMAKHQRFLETELSKYLDQPTNSPDIRLGGVIEIFQKREFIQNLLDIEARVAARFFGKVDNELLTKFQELGIEQQEEYLSELKDQVINAIRDGVSFFVHDQGLETLESSYGILLQNWKGSLKADGTDIELQLSPRLTTENERVEMLLNHVSYERVLGCRETDNIVEPIGLQELGKLIKDRGKVECEFFLHLCDQEASSCTGKESEELENIEILPRFLVQLYDPKSQSFGFGVTNEENYKNQISVLKMNSFETGGILNIPGKIAAFSTCLSPRCYQSLIDCRSYDILSSLGVPLVIIPESNNLEAWELIIEGYPKDETLFFYHDRRDPEVNECNDLCLLVTQTGEMVYARQTSSWIFYWLLKKKKHPIRVDCLDEFGKKFGRDWLVRLQVNCKHIIKYGF